MTYDVYYQQHPVKGRLSEERLEAAHHNMNYEYDDSGGYPNPPVNL